MKVLLFVSLLFSSSLYAQEKVVSQWELMRNELAKKFMRAVITPSPILYSEHQQKQLHFADVIKKYPEAVKKLKEIQSKRWDLDSPRNFLSFSYKDLKDVYDDKVGFCSGYTYVTWMMRYLLTIEEDGKLMTPPEMIAELHKVLYEFRTGRITGISGMEELSLIPEVRLYLKKEIGRTWQESSITTEGAGMYIDQFTNKPVKWDALLSKVNDYWKNGIYPILYAVNRESWSKFGQPSEVRMIHVMPAMSYQKFDLMPLRESDVFQKNPEYLREMEPLAGAGSLNLLHTLNKPLQRIFIRSGNDALMIGYDAEKDSALVRTYMDVIYYQDWLAARVALALVGAKKPQ